MVSGCIKQHGRLLGLRRFLCDNRPEMLGGRVKTLHPNIHGGLLANRTDTSHMQTLEELGVQPIDLVSAGGISDINYHDGDASIWQVLLSLTVIYM